MSYKEQLYKNALKCIDDIYTRSKYDNRIDLYRSFDIINSVNDNQIESKEWLVEKLLPYIDPKGRYVCILGGWYGITGLILQQHSPVKIDTIDSDPYCKKYGKMLTRSDRMFFHTSTAEDWFFDSPKKYQCIINTSIEHMEKEDIDLMVGLKREEAVVCFQGNNYHEVQSHINTHDTLEEFVNSFKLKEIYFTDEIELEGGHKRFMVIGK